MTHAVANVRTGAEIAMTEWLQETGRAAYCPTASCKGKRQPGGARETVVKAAFPGYLFVAADTIGYADDIFRDPRFNYFLRTTPEEIMAGKKHGLVSDKNIGVLRTLESRGVFQPNGAGKPRFRTGELLRVPDGVFGGMTGEVVMTEGAAVWLDGYDFTVRVRFDDGLQLVSEAV